MRTKPNIAESNVHGRNAATPPVVGNGSSSYVSGEFHSFLADIEDMIKATTSLTGEDLAHARAKLNARVIAAKESVEEMSSAIAEQARNTAKATDGYVHSHPWQAIGIGAAMSLLIGLAFARGK